MKMYMPLLTRSSSERLYHRSRPELPLRQSAKIVQQTHCAATTITGNDPTSSLLMACPSLRAKRQSPICNVLSSLQMRRVSDKCETSGSLC
eukprot:scaffold164155_cov40-Tisochrysis_lutea.AAC.2